jgi:hypothetical protein
MNTEPGAAAPDALFVTDGVAWSPTELSRGPWDAGSLHGGPVAALMGARWSASRHSRRCDWPA